MRAPLTWCSIAVWLSAAPPAAAAEPLWLGTAPEPAAIERIVSLAPSTTEILFALGVGDRVVGVTRYDDFPPEVLKLPKVGGFIDAEPEAILRLKPDVVVGVPTSGGRGTADTLARVGVPVLTVPAESISDLWAAIDAVGKAVGAVAEADRLLGQLERSRQEFRRKYAGTPAVRVAVILGYRPIVTAGPGSYLDALLQDVGATNVVTRGGSFPVLDLEALARLDPDVIVDVSFPQPGGEHSIDRLRAVPAVKDGRTVRIAEDAVVRPGPRLPQALKLLGDAVHTHIRR